MDTTLRRSWIIVGLLLAAASAVPSEAAAQLPPADADGFRSSFELDPGDLATVGHNRYWHLEPGFRIVLAGEDSKVVITVLDETEAVGEYTTRVIEEREWSDDSLVEVSRNYFAISRATGDVYYFGEDVDTFEDDELSGHPGSWRAFNGDNRPGLMMPGSPHVGLRYYQELAPGVAMDRAEIVDLDATFTTPAGAIYEHCVRTVESSALESHDRSRKVYAPGVGLVFDDGVSVASHGFVPEGARHRKPMPLRQSEGTTANEPADTPPTAGGSCHR